MKKHQLMEIHMCGVKKWSAHKINEHHRESNPPVLCDICGKECSTPLSLECHRYNHNKQPFHCDICNQGFQFASELVGHQIKHHTIKAFICAYAKCGRSFMRKSELTAHSITHSGKNTNVSVETMKQVINAFTGNINEHTQMRSVIHVNYAGRDWSTRHRCFDIKRTNINCVDHSKIT